MSEVKNHSGRYNEAWETLSEQSLIYRKVMGCARAYTAYC